MKISVGVIAITVVVSLVWSLFHFKQTEQVSSIGNKITSVIQEMDSDSSSVRENTVVIQAEVKGIICKVFVEKNNMVESDKVIAMIGRTGSSSKEHDYFIVRSPGAGKLSRVIVQEGDTVERGEKLFEMLLPGE